MVALVKHVASSPLLANPEEEKHGKVVFFDLLGLVTVVYPERLALIINSILVLASLGTVYLATVRSKKLSHGQQSGMFVCVCCILCACVFNYRI